jgi:hypothetical protein
MPEAKFTLRILAGLGFRRHFCFADAAKTLCVLSTSSLVGDDVGKEENYWNRASGRAG